jgi:hypothetical protein
VDITSPENTNQNSWTFESSPNLGHIGKRKKKVRDGWIGYCFTPTDTEVY